jgi:hypothetical protein
VLFCCLPIGKKTGKKNYAAGTINNLIEEAGLANAGPDVI